MVAEDLTWGTWEELLLGGAVLRHGTRDWVTVAAELRARAQCPYTFTPEVCRAKYDDLQRCYPGCKTWFEEVRKKRMEELRRALEVSEDSIGSLETKLETLKAEKAGESRGNYASSQTESPVASQRSEWFESFSRESKDGLSAGSFTLETRTDRSTVGQTPPAEEEKDPIVVGDFSGNVEGTRGATLKKRRGLRKKRNGGGFVEAAEKSGSFTLDCPKRDEIDDLLKVFNSIVEHKCASTFRHRLDSQKRGRYKKMIRRHVDFDALRSRITSRSIETIAELFRDLLLLANNALVFYSKSTREHKSAAVLRGLVAEALRGHFSGGSNSGGAVETTTASGSPAKPRSVVAQPGKKSLSTKITDSEINDVSQPKKVGRKSNFRQQSATPAKAMKRVRTR